MSEDPRLSRTDLPALKSADRSRVFAALRSFDTTGLNEEQFMRRALAASDVGLALTAARAACARSRDTGKPELPDSVLAMANKVLAPPLRFLRRDALPVAHEAKARAAAQHASDGERRESGATILRSLRRVARVADGGAPLGLGKLLGAVEPGPGWLDARGRGDTVETGPMHEPFYWVTNPSRTPGCPAARHRASDG